MAYIRITALTLIGSAFMAFAGGPNAAGPAIDKSKLVGVWELVNGPIGTLEFTADGKMHVRIKVGAEDVLVVSDFVLKDDRLTYTLSGEGKAKIRTSTILKVDDGELRIRDSKGRVEEYRRKGRK